MIRVLPALLLLAGCVSSTGTRHVVERVQGVQGGQPIDVRRETIEETESQTKVELPPIATPILTAASAATGIPWETILAAVGGLGVASATGVKAMQFKRHRDQLIAGIEEARDEIPDDIDAKVCARLAARQDQDLQTVIQRRTA
jgi:hypothetical protein